jgi:hypothetical protein
VTSRRYNWVEDWLEPGSGPAPHSWAHHGLSLTSAGQLVAFEAESSTLLVYARDGVLERSAPVPVFEGHDLLVVSEDGVDHVWIADIGLRSEPQSDGTYSVAAADEGGQAVLVRLDGTVARRLPTPPVPEYVAGRYCPAAIAVDEERHGGSGDVWVADAYGQSLLHRFGSDGSYRGTIRGDEATGPGRLDCPHGLVVDRRRGRPELLVADRGNARVLAYTMEGEFTRVAGVGLLTAPSSLAVSGRLLVIAEHRGSRLTLLDEEDGLVEYVGRDETAVDRAGWPNAVGADGRIVAPRPAPGRFNSPHGLAVGTEGELFVAEWVVGGRLVRLDPQ